MTEKSKQFRKSFYGMFVHYGLYSAVGRGEWLMCSERIPFDEYKKLADSFNPEGLFADDWARLAAESGMRYMCLTTRHHDGFALWNSRASDYNSVKAPCGRDIVGEYVAACRKRGIRVGLYYSVGDWSSPGFAAGPKKDPGGWAEFVSEVHEQLVELMTDYGEIDYLFYDGCPPPETWGCTEINTRIRELQPGILISDRCGLEEDVKSAEKKVMPDPGKLWESCDTINDSWGYNYADSNWKTPYQIVKKLLFCAHHGGNFLLNVGPKEDGTVQKEAVDVLGSVGEWISRNEEAVYGSEAHPFDLNLTRYMPTARGATAYIPVDNYYGPDTVVAGIGNRVESVSILSGGEDMKFRQEGARLFLEGLPASSPEPYFPVLKVKLDGKPRGVPDPLLEKARYE